MSNLGLESQDSMEEPTTRTEESYTPQEALAEIRRIVGMIEDAPEKEEVARPLGSRGLLER